jgi:hypothetical protein
MNIVRFLQTAALTLIHNKDDITFRQLKLDLRNVVAGEGAEYSGALRGADKPAVVTLLHNKDDIPFRQLHFVIVLGFVVVHSTVPAHILHGWIS